MQGENLISDLCTAVVFDCVQYYSDFTVEDYNLMINKGFVKSNTLKTNLYWREKINQLYW